MAFIDYYKTLGVNKNATQDDIKSLSKTCPKMHPDLNPDDKEAHHKFQELNEANEVLSDPEKRAKYDKYGEHWKNGEEYEKYEQARQQQQSSQRAYSSGGFSGSDFGEGEDFSDFSNLCLAAVAVDLVLLPEEEVLVSSKVRICMQNCSFPYMKQQKHTSVHWM